MSGWSAQLLYNVVKRSNGRMEEKSRTHLAKRYEVPYQPTSFREWKSVVILGMAYKISYGQY